LQNFLLGGKVLPSSGAMRLEKDERWQALKNCLSGFVTGEGRLGLVEKDGETEVRYSGEAQVGGLIASVRQRMLEGATRRIVQQFFDAAAAELRSSVRR
jgi:carbon monoxide dehydrogenase subunit G